MSSPSDVPIVEHKHWIEQLGQQVVANGQPPYTITAGMTTSGPTHMGTLCEMLYPQAICNYLAREGHSARYLFIADILDAFDSVPNSHKEFEQQLAPYLGKPLCKVPDPQGCCKSLGEHFLNDSLGVAKAFGVHPQIVLAEQLYSSGAMDEITKLFISRADDCRNVLSTTSLNPNLPADWAPIMPICQHCGKIATTRVTKLYPDAYEWACTKDAKYVKGCGQSGKSKISDHQYKLVWRLHWPAWMKHFGTSIEGAGMDHHTRGGSWDTCQAVFKQIFNQPPPVGYQFGFVLFQGAKYSKSKGIGMGVKQLLSLLPPEVLAFALLRPDLTENRDINPTSENLLRMIAEFQDAGRLAENMGLLSGSKTASSDSKVQQSISPSAELSRAERKRALAFALSSAQPVWKVDFSDLLIYYGLYNNWDAVAQKLGHAGDIARLAPFVQAWQAQGLVPDDYQFKFQPTPTDDPLILEWATRLQPNMSALDIHTLVFTVAKEAGAKPGELFARLYQTLIRKPRGPKMGRLVEILGVARVKDALLTKP
ncbi:MAG: lysine--tRNA ligase [Candidatus Micrarchaeota archaeon]|nr:lysine--tRNA ligase [Candidatus Micrarchaeota archaeon]